MEEKNLTGGPMRKEKKRWLMYKEEAVEQ